jgi:hypothetical protein
MFDAQHFLEELGYIPNDDVCFTPLCCFASAIMNEEDKRKEFLWLKWICSLYITLCVREREREREMAANRQNSVVLYTASAS